MGSIKYHAAFAQGHLRPTLAIHHNHFAIENACRAFQAERDIKAANGERECQSPEAGGNLDCTLRPPHRNLAESSFSFPLYRNCPSPAAAIA